jgi:hypothetical protein
VKGVVQFSTFPGRSWMEFAQRFTNLKGKFVFCENTGELVSQLRQVIANNKWDKVFCKEEGLRTILAETISIIIPIMTCPPAIPPSQPVNGW